MGEKEIGFVGSARKIIQKKQFDEFYEARIEAIFKQLNERIEALEKAYYHHLNERHEV